MCEKKFDKRALITFIEQNRVGNYDENKTFKDLTSYRIGGRISLYVCVNNFIKLQQLMRYCLANHVPYYIIGRGTNLLSSEEDFDIVLISLKLIKTIWWLDDNNLIVSAGYSSMNLGLKLSRLGYENYEGLAVIPGSIGGAVYMNASAYKKTLEKIVTAVIYLDEHGLFKLYRPPFFNGYRQSIFQSLKGIICYVFFKASKASDILLPYQKVQTFWEQKRNNQPLNTYNAGSVFKNPEGYSVWQLIDNCGLRGQKVGGALISPKHTNFFVNDDNASFVDMVTLIEKVKYQIALKYQLWLECEIKILYPKDISPF